jgi:cytochrome c-type biogenesis protein CcmH
VRSLLLLGLILLSVPTITDAATPVDIYEFESPAQEARYRALIDEFRCPKCLNTNLSGSDAPIAQDLRRTVHRLVVVEGRSDDEIRDFLQQRYGDFVLYNPPLRPGTLVLWGAPIAFALIGLLVLWRVLRQSNRAVQLSASDEARIAEIVDSPANSGKTS